MSNLSLNFQQNSKYKAAIQFTIENAVLANPPYSIDVAIRNQVQQNQDKDLSTLVWKDTIELSKVSTDTLRGYLLGDIAGYVIDRPAESSLALWMFLACKNFSITRRFAIIAKDTVNRYFEPKTGIYAQPSNAVYSGYQWAVGIKRDNLNVANNRTNFSIIPTYLDVINYIPSYVQLRVGGQPIGESNSRITVSGDSTTRWNISGVIYNGSTYPSQTVNVEAYPENRAAKINGVNCPVNEWTDVGDVTFGSTLTINPV